MPKDDLPIPDTRCERLLNSIATGEDVSDEVEVISDMDKYLYYIAENGAGGEKPGTAVWGKISGSIADQTDLVHQLEGKATTSDMNALRVQLNNKADASDLSNLIGQIDSKANATDLNNLRTVVDSKANASDLSNLSAVVDSKASTTDLNNLSTLVNEKATTKVFSATLNAESWSSSAPYTQTVSVSGVLPTDNPLVDIVLSSTTATAKNEATAWGCVSKITTASDAITATCLEEKPTVNMTIQLKVVR
jgi:hypothetical protein